MYKSKTETIISEKLLSHIWQSGCLTNLVSNSGEKIQIIHPGRFTNGTNGDFQDTVLLINGERICGNVEVHIKCSQWYSHGHHRNPRYNNTILHVAYCQDSQNPTRLQNGKIIPLVCLNHYIEQIPDINCNSSRAYEGTSPPCPYTKRLPAKRQLLELLAAAGWSRFVAKAGSFLKSLDEKEPGQVIYEGLARALGYSQNSETFEKLANRLELKLIESLSPKDNMIQQALILGTAGLLPSQRARIKNFAKNAEVEILERNWKCLNINQTMKETDWCFFRIHPNNFPTRRLVALSHLLDRYSKSGLLQEMLKLVMETPEKLEHRWLIDSLTIPAQNYWSNHYDFGVVSPRNHALVGQNKATEIVINTLLPFATAWSRITADTVLECKAIEIYHRFTKSADNELTRYMKQQLLIDSARHLSASHHQGLIQIFKIYCRYRDCANCPIASSQG